MQLCLISKNYTHNCYQNWVLCRKILSASGGEAPQTPGPGALPLQSPQTPVIGSRYRARHKFEPYHFFERSGASEYIKGCLFWHSWHSFLLHATQWVSNIYMRLNLVTRRCCWTRIAVNLNLKLKWIYLYIYVSNQRASARNCRIFCVACFPLHSTTLLLIRRPRKATG